MAEYVKPLNKEQLAEYEKIIAAVRQSETYKKWRAAQEKHKKEVVLAQAAFKKGEKGNVFAATQKAEAAEKKLLQKMTKEFEKKAQNMAGGFQMREGKKSFWDRVLRRKPKQEKYVPVYVTNAFYKELDLAGAFKMTYNDGARQYNEFHGLKEPKHTTTVSRAKVEQLRGIKSAPSAQKPDIIDEMYQSIVQNQVAQVSQAEPQKPAVQTRSDVYTALEVYARISAMEEMSGMVSSGITYNNGMDKNACMAVLQKAAPEEIRQAATQIKADATQKPFGNADFNARALDAVDKLQQQYAPERAAPNKYAALDNGQFSVAMGTAYENLVWMEHHGASKEAKEDVLGEIKQIVAEAQKRWPNAAPETLQGSYFKDADVAAMEQQLMPYMREAAKEDRVFASDVRNYEAWRHNRDAVISTGSVAGPAVTEKPFQNAARYGENCAEKRDLPTNCFKDPYKSGSNVMSAAQVAQMRAELAKIRV